MRRSLVSFLTVVLAVISDGGVAAQPMLDSPTLGGVAVFGTARTRANWWDWFGNAPEGDYSYPAVLIRVGLTQVTRTVSGAAPGRGPDSRALRNRPPGTGIASVCALLTCTVDS